MKLAESSGLHRGSWDDAQAEGLSLGAGWGGGLLRASCQPQGTLLCPRGPILSCIMSFLGWPVVGTGQLGALFDVQAKGAAAKRGLS